MVRLELAFLDFMDQRSIGDLPVNVRVLVTPRYFHRPHDVPAEPDHPDEDDVLVADSSLGQASTVDTVADAAGRAQVELDVDAAWSAVAQVRKDGALPRDVVGYVTTHADLPWIDLRAGRPVLLARSPNASLSAVVLVDAAKIIVGHTTPTSSRILFQLHGYPREGYRFLAELRTEGGAPERHVLAIGNDLAHTSSTSFDGLQPSTAYAIELVADAVPGEGRAVLARGEVRTLAAAPSVWNLAFTSCHLPTNAASLRPWIRAAAKPSADMLLMLGDQIYGDGIEKHNLASTPWFDRYVRRYNQLWVYQPMRDVLRRTPSYAMFDDHEVVDDWGIASEEEIGRERIAGALDAYRRFQGGLNPPSATPSSFDYGWRHGSLAAYMLDERSQRGRSSEFHVLGLEQLDRFRAWARSADTREADVVIVGSTVPLAYLPTQRLMEAAGSAVVQTGMLAGAAIGAAVGGPVGALIGGFLGAVGSDIAYDEYTEDLREPDVQDQWVHEHNQNELALLLEALFDLANDIQGGVPGPRPRAVFVLTGDVHVGAFHLLKSNRKGDGHDHRRNSLIYQLTSSPSTTAPPDNPVLKALLDEVGGEVDIGHARFLAADADLETSSALNVTRFVLDSHGAGHYGAEFLGVVRERNFGRLVIEHRGDRRYRFSTAIEGGSDSLVSLFEIDLDAPRIVPRDLVGERLRTVGTPVLLRVNERDSGYGPPSDRLDAELIVQLDSEPGRAFGLQLRPGPPGASHRGMLRLLRDAFNENSPVTIEYDRTGLRNGMIVRVVRGV